MPLHKDNASQNLYIIITITLKKTNTLLVVKATPK